MPKEYIRDEHYGVRAPVDMPDGTTSEETYLVSDAMMKVTWGRDTYVQAAVVTDKDPDGFEAQHISLNRYGINQLIKTLRRARDAAYGKDE